MHKVVAQSFHHSASTGTCLSAPYPSFLSTALPSTCCTSALKKASLASKRQCAQEFVKQHLGASAVSQRDLQRAFRFLDFFLAQHKARGAQLEQGRLVHRCLLLSMAVTYYFRLPAAVASDSDTQQDGLRLQFCHMMTALRSPAGRYRPSIMPWDVFEDVVADELRLYIEGAQLPPGIAANLALMENFFCIAVCMQTKTPLIIVGTPGEECCS